MPTQPSHLRFTEPSASLTAAGRWLLTSGIQEPSGGVARYYVAGEGRNMPVSNEITGYAASTLVYFYQASWCEQYLEAARQAARFLVKEAWNRQAGTFPFECGEGSPAYFFDCGIIIRGLLAVWRITREPALLEVAQECGRSMARDFLTPARIHPAVSLPERRVLVAEPRWSRQPGCYQLKSALAWRDLAQATGDGAFRQWWGRALEMALASHASFLPGTPDREKVMDRLHAYCYFLEALLAEHERPACRAALVAGLDRVAEYLGETAPLFVRSDVYAQMLRVRLLLDAARVKPLDPAQAEQEATALRSFQYTEGNPRLEGGYCFGRREGEMMGFANPASTAFAAQALEFLRLREAGEAVPALDWLV